MTYLQEHVCVTLAKERVLYLDGVKVPKTQGWDIKYV